MILKILSWNVNGLNSPQKRRKIFHYLKQYNNDVVCLQETHIRTQDQKLLISKIGLQFISSSRAKRNGLVFYIAKRIPAKLIEADDEGRYVAVVITVQNVEVLLIGIYAPNQQQESFYKMLNEKILQWNYKSFLIMGDWNGVIDVTLDKKTSAKKGNKLPQTFFAMKEELELKDVWRIHHPEELDFTFFSDRHKSFSRIDFMLATTDLLNVVTKTKIFPRTLTDHSPVWIEMNPGKRERRSWRMNENIFRYEKYIKELKEQIKEFFYNNLNKGTPIEIVWDACKAYMRGVLIHMNSRHKMNRQKSRLDLEMEIKDKEQLLIKNPTDEKVLLTIKLLKEQFQMLMAEQTATTLQYAKHNTFCNANKPGRWLAYILRKQQNSRMINAIEYKGKRVHQQNLIHQAFLTYYSKLYQADKVKEDLIDEYLQKKRVTKISSTQSDRLERPITSEEILYAIKQLKLSKAPGTDGLTAVFYKTLQEELIESLKDLFCNIQQGGKIPPSWKTAFISLIPKEEDSAKPENFRPISLLNTDYKIFAKVLANRLMPVIQDVIHEDQAGFIEGRYMKDNVRQLIDLLEYLDEKKQISAVLVFLDAEKAFDRVNWDFLKKILHKMNFGDQFIQAISAIYQEQTAQIIINGSLTTNFNIQKGTRQGCPLSPLLFILTLEVLLNALRDSDKMSGIVVGQTDYRTKAFADDLIVTLTRPLESIIQMKNIIEEYGLVSGFSLNQKKTKMIVKNMLEPQRKELERVAGFEIAIKVKYLGIQVAASNKKLFQNNYEELWHKIQKDLDTWKKLQLSLLGRIAAVKMNVLPRFLFLFQMIPVLKNDKYLMDWQAGLNKFIWSGKKPRVKFKIMQDVRERGGLKVPNLRLYYEAAALIQVGDWIGITKREILNIEGHDLQFGWHAYLLYEDKRDSVFNRHILRHALLRVWKKHQLQLDYKIPLWLDLGHILPKIKSLGGLLYKEILFMDGGSWCLKSWNTLLEDGVNLTWLQYFQLQARWREDQKIGLMLHEEDLVTQIKCKGPMHIKRLYNLLLERDSEGELVKDCMIKWAQNFDQPVMLETWEKIWVQNVKFTQAQNLRENFYKMFYRWHLDPKKLSCMYPNVQPKCWRCDCLDATYFHIWWTCRKLKPFWIKLWWVMQNILKKKLEFSPQFFLLGIVKGFSVIDTRLILYMISAARLLIGQYWKKDKVPTIEEWILKMSNLAEMAKISAYLKERTHEVFVKEWRKWVDYMKKKYQSKKFQLVLS